MNFKKFCAVIFVAASVIVTNFCITKISADEALKKLKIVLGEYQLETGKVQILEGVKGH